MQNSATVGHVSANTEGGTLFCAIERTTSMLGLPGCKPGCVRTKCVVNCLAEGSASTLLVS